MVWPVRGRAEKDGGRVGMKIGGRIRELRATRGMSQDDLAARVYVSRQTISSWENGKTYPDVQSLLLLSEIFGASVDSLIKGDVNAMNETIDRDAKTMKRLTYAMFAFLLLMIAALAWAVVQLVAWDWPLPQTAPSFTLAFVLWGIAMFAAYWIECIKRDHNLVTYLEVLDFLNGVEPNRDTERGRRERSIPSWMRVVRSVGMGVLAAAVGDLCARYGAQLLQGLLG